MDAARLRNWCTLGDSKPNPLDYVPLQDHYSPANFLTSDFSRYGVGSKKAIFNIGKSVTVETRALDSQDVVEVTLDSELMEQSQKPWSANLKISRTNDHIPLSYTKLTISRIKEPYIQSYNAVIVRQKLAHIYHYYIFGPWYVLRIIELIVL